MKSAFREIACRFTIAENVLQYLKPYSFWRKSEYTEQHDWVPECSNMVPDRQHTFCRQSSSNKCTFLLFECRNIKGCLLSRPPWELACFVYCDAQVEGNICTLHICICKCALKYKALINFLLWEDSGETKHYNLILTRWGGDVASFPERHNNFDSGCPQNICRLRCKLPRGLKLNKVLGDQVIHHYNSFKNNSNPCNHNGHPLYGHKYE